jgi:hypothetical protein
MYMHIHHASVLPYMICAQVSRSPMYRDSSIAPVVVVVVVVGVSGAGGSRKSNEISLVHLHI